MEDDDKVDQMAEEIMGLEEQLNELKQLNKHLEAENQENSELMLKMDAERVDLIKQINELSVKVNEI